MITVINQGKTNVYYGTSLDEKPVQESLNGSVFFEIDTGDVFIFNGDTLSWVLQ